MNNRTTDEKGNIIVEDIKIRKDTTYVVFYFISVMLVLYMGFAAYTSYQTFADYCANYNMKVTNQMGMLFQTVLASIVPCIAYAATMYGIGYLIKNKK